VDWAYLNLIKSGRKTVEGRCATQRYRDLQVGQEIVFRPSDSNESSEPSEIKAVVCKVTWYETFEAMLLSEGLQSCLPDVPTVAMGCQIYRAFPNYAENEAKLGVIAIQFRFL